MTTQTRAFPAVKTAPAIVLAWLCCASLLALAPAALGAVSYEKESFAEYEHQLASGQIAEVTINKYIRTLRVTLKDGRHVLAKYPKHEEPREAAKLKAKGVPFTVLTPEVAQKEAKNAPVHHKLRYIAGGIVIAVIVIVGAVLLIMRRRRAVDE
jgi:hypothetical protein